METSSSDSDEANDDLGLASLTKTGTFPREWEELMLPDENYLQKEKWKYAWRRAIFYVYFVALLIYIQRFPRQLQVEYILI